MPRTKRGRTLLRVGESSHERRAMSTGLSAESNKTPKPTEDSYDLKAMNFIVPKSSAVSILILIPFITYLLTLCPTVYVGDSGELTAAAFCLGVPHNSGYPLYCLLGKVFCLIPIGSIAFRTNLMSACLGVGTIGLVYSVILRRTGERVPAVASALFLAFTPLFWFQTVSAEVYTLHAFFVAMLIRVLVWWEEKREFSILVVFALVTGLSFGNHLQTVMLAPGVYYLILAVDRKALLNGKRFLVLSLFFVLPLFVYLYLPIRTEVGSAIHWGDPNTWERFWLHVSGQAHREVYVFSKTVGEYVDRAKEALLLVWSQFGVLLGVSAWGWVASTMRWRVFWGLVILFDFVYTVFLNIISLQVTAFNIPTAIVLSILMGDGIHQGLKQVSSLVSTDALRGSIRAGCLLFPLVLLAANHGLCNQGRNYTAYEWAVNTARTLEPGSILLLEGDNNLFPVLYLRVVERGREDLILYDRQNIFFKMPYLGRSAGVFHGDWEALRTVLEREIIIQKQASGVYYSMFETHSLSLPSGYRVIPYGVVHRIVPEEALANPYKIRNPWVVYATESFYDDYERDFLSRQVASHFLYRQGLYVFMGGGKLPGRELMLRASRMGRDDPGILSMIGITLAEEGFYEEGKQELEKAALQQRDRSITENNWGCFYQKKKEHEQAVKFFDRAIQLKPQEVTYRKNLGFALYDLGRSQEAAHALQRSLEIKADQPQILEFMRKRGLHTSTEERENNRP